MNIESTGTGGENFEKVEARLNEIKGMNIGDMSDEDLGNVMAERKALKAQRVEMMGSAVVEAPTESGEIEKITEAEKAEAEAVAEAENAKLLEERKQAEAAQIDALRAEISGTNKPEQEIDNSWQQANRDFFEELTGGDMGKIQRAAIIEKYLREEIEKRGIVTNKHVLNRLISILETRDSEGNVTGYGKVEVGQIQVPKTSTDNLVVYDKILGGDYEEPFIEERSPEVRQEEDLEFKQLGEALKVATEKADAEISSMVVLENSEYREVRRESIGGGVSVIPPGEHWIIDSVAGGVVKVEKGAKLTITKSLEGGVVTGEKGSLIEILGEQTGGIVRAK